MYVIIITAMSYIYLFVSLQLCGDILGEQYEKENKKMNCWVRLILSFNFISMQVVRDAV